MEIKFSAHKNLNGFHIEIKNDKCKAFCIADYINKSERWNVTEVIITMGVDKAKILLSDNMILGRSRLIEIINYLESFRDITMIYKRNN